MKALSVNGARILLVVGSLVWLHPAGAHFGHGTGPAFTPCRIGMPDTAFHMQAKCTSLPVAENPAKPDGKRIDLHIAVLPAHSSKPSADALFYLAGGPGQAATEAFVTEAAAFSRIRTKRDIVLIDQRGTGGSNRLDCPAASNAEESFGRAAALKQAKACLAQLKADPRFYTTTVAVKDLDAVRRALGYGQIDLYGISYGTRVALEYLRKFPAHVRSVILDGVVPPDWNVGSTVSLDAQHSLDRIFDRCARQPDCRRAFPDLKAEFLSLQRKLEAHPAKLELRDPDKGTLLAKALTWNKAAGAIRLLSYSSDTAALLPLLIHQAAANDYAPLMAQALIFSRSVNEGIAEGMYTEVLCTEDVPFYKHDKQHASEGYVGARPLDSLLTACSVWPRGIMAADFKQPVKSNKPVLLISGRDDPITPPSNAEHVAQTLSNSLSLTVPGQGHGNAMRGCIPRLMSQFVSQASVKGLDQHCVDSIRAFPFFVNFNGPRP